MPIATRIVSAQRLLTQQIQLDVSNIQSSKNTTGLPDGGDGSRIKDFFAVYQLNYCSGRKHLEVLTTDFCSKSTRQLFDYTDHDWEDYGADFLNVTGSVSKPLIKRKGGGRGGRMASAGLKTGGKSSGAKSTRAMMSTSDPARTNRAKSLSKASDARPVYAATIGPTYRYRLWAVLVALAVVGVVLAAFAFSWLWGAIAAAAFTLVSQSSGVIS